MEGKKDFRRRVNILAALIPITLCVSYMLSVFSSGVQMLFEPDPFWFDTFAINMIYMVVYAAAILTMTCLIFSNRPGDFVPVSIGRVGEKALFLVAGMGAVTLVNIIYSVFLSIVSDLFRFEIADWTAGMTLPQSGGEWIGYAVMTTVMPAVLEELVFRGAVLGILKRRNAAAAVVVSAVLFGFFHGTIEQIPVTLAIGLMLGYFCLKFDSILVPMAFHFLNNLLATVEMFIVQTCEETTAGLVTTAINLAVIVLGIVALCLIAAKYRFSIPKKEPGTLGTRDAFSAALSAPVLWVVILFYAAEAVILNAIYT